MLVADLMIPRFVYVKENAALSHAAEVLALTGVNDLIVLDDEDKIVGTLSDGDVLRALMPDLEELYQADISYAELNKYFSRLVSTSKDKSILPLIVRNFITVNPTDTIIKAVTIMLNFKIIRLPVVENGICIGVIGRNDINWNLRRKQIKE